MRGARMVGVVVLAVGLALAFARPMDAMSESAPAQPVSAALETATR